MEVSPPLSPSESHALPELPEVETTRRQLSQCLQGRRIGSILVRRHDLRWPISPEIAARWPGERLQGVGRRGKYLIFDTAQGAAISHLGMSGRWSVISEQAPYETHDHVEIEFEGKLWLRYHDPRRFGALLWGGSDPQAHPRLAELGPEPIGGPDPASLGDHLWRRSRQRKIALRDFLLDGKVLVGVGNIYASEAAHRAAIRPTRAARTISRARYRRLSKAIRWVLEEAIERGGTTLRDYQTPRGESGESTDRCLVYGRAGQSCHRCGSTILRKVLGARALYFCRNCQR